MCPLRWMVKSTTHWPTPCKAMGHKASPDTEGRLRHAMGYSQATSRQIEGTNHLDRDAQFHYRSTT